MVPVLRAFIKGSESTKVVVVFTATAVVGVEKVVEVGSSEVKFSILDGVDFSSVVFTSMSFSSNNSSFVEKLSALGVKTGFTKGSSISSDEEPSIMRSENSRISLILMFLLISPTESDHSLAKSRRKSFFCVEAHISSTPGAKKEAKMRKKHIMNKDLRAIFEDVFRLKPLIFNINGQY